MDFATAISTGAGVKFTTEAYAYSLIEFAATDPHNWLNNAAHHFVGQCFNAVGLEFKVTLEDFKKNCVYPYRNDNLAYIFNPVKFVLQGVETFLHQLPSQLDYYSRKVTREVPISSTLQTFYDLTHPVNCYLRMIVIWTNVVLSITDNLQQTDNKVDRFLCEPLARLSFAILRGLVKLLPQRGHDAFLLKDICLKLSVLARFGILYEETYDYMLVPMLNIFKEHFKLFLSTGAALNFIYLAFTCEMTNKESYLEIYKFLEAMLLTLAEGQQRDESGNLYLRIFSNELITDKFLAIQFEGLKAHNGNRLLLATLCYLYTLQRHIVSTEIFPERFLEQILLVLLHTSVTPPVCSEAAHLYRTLAMRQYQSQEIVVHILETFLKTQYNLRRCASYEQALNVFKTYLENLVDHLPAVQQFKYYIHVINAEDVRTELVIITAQAIIALFKLYTEYYAYDKVARKQIPKLLRHLPRLIERNAQRQEIRVVLYGLYSIVDFKTIVKKESTLLMTLEKRYLQAFLKDDTLTETEFNSLFRNICRSVQATGQDTLILYAAQAVQDEYLQLSEKLLSAEKEEQPQILESYAKCVRRLYAVLRENKMRWYHVCYVYESLAAQLLGAPVENECLAIYGYEALAFILALLHRERQHLEEFQEYDTIVIKLGLELRDVCLRELSKLPEKLPLVKSLICSILVLQLALRHGLTLDTAAYDVVLDQLSNPELVVQVRTNTLHLNCVREMYLLFRQLHSCQMIPLPNHRVWKLLLQYKMVKTQPDYLNPELANLIAILIKNRFETYARCLPIIQLHICNDRSTKRYVPSALAAHLQLLEENATQQEAWLLRVHVFNVSLELLLKNLCVRRVDVGRSRQRERQNHQLMPLQYLMPLVNNLRLEPPHFNNFARLLYNLRTNVSASADANELEKFITQISAFKYRCEDELAPNAAGGTLQPQPPGPLNLWQTEAFGYLMEHNSQEKELLPPIPELDEN